MNATLPANFQGWVEDVCASYICGWVADISRAEESLSVDISVNGNQVARIKASTFRPDIQKAGFGNGRKGFSFCPADYLGVGVNEIRVSLADSEIVVPNGQQCILLGKDSSGRHTGTLDPSPIVAVCEQPSLSSSKVVRRSFEVQGWAMSRAGIESVEVFVDGKPRGNIAYGMSRPDVASTYPQFGGAGLSGYMGRVSAEDLVNGYHEVMIRIRSRDGGKTDLLAPLEVDNRWMAVGEVPDINADYQLCVEKHVPSEAALSAAQDEASRFLFQPTISLLLSVSSTNQNLLEGTIRSVQSQVYEYWELCLAVDVAAGPIVRNVLTRLAEADERIKVVLLDKSQGTCAASHEVLRLAGGAFVARLECGDRLSPLALLEVARVLQKTPELDLIYSDEDKVNNEGTVRWDPFHKPDWSPDLLLSMDYLGRLALYRRTLVESVGGFRTRYEGCREYDLTLRITEQTTRIHHIPQVLYSRRADPYWNGEQAAARWESRNAARRALAEALERRGLAARLESDPQGSGHWRVRYALREYPGITLIIPSGGKLQYLEACLKSILTESTYPNIRILVIDNSEGTQVAALCEDMAKYHPKLQRQEFRLKPFNYSALNNFALQFVTTPYVVLLNDDMTVITPDWVQAMLEHAQRPEVGIVGSKLLFPNNTIQHAGVVLGPYGASGHAYKHLPAKDTGYFGMHQVVRNCSAVTFACAMMRRSVYEEVGGLDADHLPMAFNDVDMCLRVRERGYWIVYTPYAVLHHHESVTKSGIFGAREIDHFRGKWERLIQRDPFYNPHLTTRTEDCSLKREERPEPVAV